MADVHPGLKKIIFHRLFLIGLWHITISALVLQFIASVDFNNLSLFWIISWTKNVVNLRFFVIAFYQFLFSSCFVLTESYQYLRVNSCYKISRFRFILQKLFPVNFLWFLVYFIRSVLAVLVFSTAFDSYFNYSVKNSKEGRKNPPTEYTMLLILSSLWLNILSFIHDFVYQKSFKYFPLVRTHYSSFIPTVVSTAKDVSIRSLYHCFGFIVVFLIFSFAFCDCLFNNLFLVSANISYTTIFSFFALYILWLYNAFFLFNISVLKLLFHVFFTSSIKFPVVAEMDTNPKALTLKEAMATSNVPILRYLTFHDLNIISQFDRDRRKQVFALSYPGGHPHTWRELSNEAMKFISDTVTQLKNVISEKNVCGDHKNLQQTNKYFSQMRPLSPSRYEKSMLISEKEEDIFEKFLTYVTSIRFVGYFSEEMKEKQLEGILQHYQALSLACYSLAYLAKASKAEDKFGIVQQDLSRIIHVLLSLHISLNKIGSVVNKNPDASILQIRKSLSSVVKSSLYELSINFGHYVNDLSLSAEDEKLFETFINFKN